MATLVWADTDTFNPNTGSDNNVSGIPVCVTFNGTDGGSGEMTVTLPTGFYPKWAMWAEDVTEGAAGNFWFWTSGMTTATYELPSGGSAFTMLAAADITSTSGTLVIDDDAITDNKAYFGVICR